MLPEYHEKEFTEQTLECNNCGWKGKGKDATVIDFFGVTKSMELHCPNCDNVIGIISKDVNKPRGESADDLSFQTG